ncbi:MAG: hypothetical protein HDR72_04090 [Ruminococcaceae bacterium]|nr:hypothetical protein [Oscillospiraceae bacterium]
MDNIFTRNLKNKLIALIAAAAVFGVLYLISQTVLNEVYLFEWTARNLYCYVWVAVAVLIVLDKLKAAYAVTTGNLLGVIIGQYLGDFIKAQRVNLITPETTPDMAHELSMHYGAGIWAITVIVCAAAGITAQVIAGKRRKSA